MIRLAPPTPPARAALRTNLTLALIPLALALLARGVDELDRQINARQLALSDLDAQLSRRRMIAAGVLPPEPDPEPAAADVEDQADEHADWIVHNAEPGCCRLETDGVHTAPADLR